MSLTKALVPLAPKTQQLISEVRPLSDYQLNYANGNYPLLSMFYAIYAGGEHTFYCDHTGDFVRAYLIDSVVDLARKRADASVAAAAAKGPEAVAEARQRGDEQIEAARKEATARTQQIGALLNTLLNKREVERIKDPDKQVVLQPSSEQLDALLAMVKVELQRYTVGDTDAYGSLVPWPVPPPPMW